MNEPNQPEQGIQAGPPTPMPDTVVLEGTGTPEKISLPPLPPVAETETASTAVGWSTFDVVLLLMLATLSVFLGSFVVTNSDFWLHLATGRGLANGTHQLGVDPFSFGSVHDGVPVPWVNHAWLFDRGLFVLYSTFGGRGIVIFQAALMVALFVLIVAVGARCLRPINAMLLAALTVLVISQRVPVAPMMVSFVMFGLLFVLLRRGGLLGGLAEGEAPSARSLWGLPLLFVFWVNMDGWFILGLATTALVVLGNAIGVAMGRPGRCALPKQGLVLLACLAACLINPFHVQAFVLPPEIAYALGKWVPVSLGPGGETLRSLEQYDRELLAGVGYVGPFHVSYRPVTAQTFTIVKVAYFLLLLLSIISFALAGWAALQPGDTSWPLGRLLVWLPFALLGGTQILSIPLFAVVAGPITILNFADYMQRRRLRSPGGQQEPMLNPNLARLAAGVLTLVALLLAWPGWLHSTIGERSPRHVAWQVQEDPSLRATAEALQKAGAKQVFNLTSDAAHYCAWFAPEVRCYFDQRLGLFAHEAAHYAKMRKQMREDAVSVVVEQRRPGKSDWPELFRTRQIDHLLITRLGDQLSSQTLAMMCWLQPWHWTQRHADGRTLAFAWSGAGQGQGDSLPAALDRAAFGRVAPEQRAPLGGANPPQTVQPLTALYLENQPAFGTLSVFEPNVHLLYFEMARQRWRGNMAHDRWRSVFQWMCNVAAWASPAGLGSAAPGSCLALFTDTNSLWMDLAFFPRQPLPPDLGPPAAPLLIIRAARRALAENPNEAAAHRALYHAYKYQSSLLEDRWIVQTGHLPDTNDRMQVRRVQLVTALRNYLDLRPDDWDMRRQLAHLFYQLHHYDAGLEQLGLAVEKLAKVRRRSNDPRQQKELLETEKGLTDDYKTFEREVKRRRGDYDLKTRQKEPMHKYGVAVLAPYEFIDANSNQPKLDQEGMGLTLEGLKQLQSISADSLPAAEKSMLHAHRCRLLIQLGRMAEATDDLLEVKDAAVQQTLLWHFAALGDYEHMDENLSLLEEQAEKQVPLVQFSRNVAHNLAALQRLHLLTEYATLPRISTLLYSNMMVLQLSMELRQAIRHRADLRTFRGLLALEVGDTARAEEHFAQALNIAGKSVHFPDRPIAERYLALVRAHRK